MENLNEIFEKIIPDDTTLQYTSFKMFSRIYKNLDYKANLVLDLGCGTGRFLTELQGIDKEVKYVGVDIEESPEVASRKRSDGDFKSYDGIHIPFDDDSVDLIYCSQVLEHVREPWLLLPDISRVLSKRGGIGSVSQLEPYHSYSVLNYTMYGIYHLFDKFGLELLELRPSIDGIELVNRTLQMYVYKNQFIAGNCFWGGTAR